MNDILNNDSSNMSNNTDQNTNQNKPLNTDQYTTSNTALNTSSNTTKNIHPNIQRIKGVANKVATTVLQFLCWYMFIHTLFWGLEQIKYTWCHKGYLQSLIFSPTPVCIMLSETSNLLTRTQITSWKTLFSFL